MRLGGNKTYVVAALTAVYAILGAALGHLGVDQAIQLLLVAGGMVGFRSALKKLE